MTKLLVLVIFILYNIMSNFAIAQEKITVRYCIDPDWMPYEAIRNNQHIGLSADYLALIEKKSRLKFELVPTTTWQQSLAALKNNQCSLSPMLNKSPERSKYLAFSDIYFRAPNVLVSKKDRGFLQDLEHVKQERVGVVKDYRLTEYVQRYYPDLNLAFFNNELSGLKALHDNEVDIFVSSMLSINSHIQEQGLSSLKIAGWAGPEDLLRMAVNLDNKPLLTKINIALNSITEEEHFTIYKKWANSTVIQSQNYKLVWQISLLALIIIISLVLRNRYVARFNETLSQKNNELEQLQHSLKQRNQELATLSTHDSLTNLYNRHFFNQRIEQEMERSARNHAPCSLILVDIDYFKRINDKYGHSVGDTILQELTGVIKANIRQIDIAARWGGEEFVILCPETNQADAIHLCERIFSAVTQFEFSQVGDLTCSGGIAEYIDPETADQWFDRTDALLYKAKNNGRNMIEAAPLPPTDKATQI